MARDNRATAVIFASVLCITNSATDSAEFRIFADAGSVVLGITDFFAETRGSLWSLECEAQHTSGTVAVFSYPATSTADDEAPRIENIWCASYLYTRPALSPDPLTLTAFPVD